MNKVARKDITQIALYIGIVILLNILGGFWYFRIDMTEEKRFTLSEATRRIARETNEIVYVKVLLEGTFPAGFKRLRDETEDMLKQLRKINPNIEFDFEDPSLGTVEQVNARRKGAGGYGCHARQS
jgi:ABC-2 type transport system permease protein